MISDISSDGKITGEELVAAGKKLMQSGGSNYRDSQEFRDDYEKHGDQLDDLAAYQNMEEAKTEEDGSDCDPARHWSREEGEKSREGTIQNGKCVPVAETKIQTPEQENKLYESRFDSRNKRLFENLVKKWTK
jgi:hypothetical protein